MNREGKLLVERASQTNTVFVLYVCTPAFLQRSRVQAKKYPDGRRDMTGDTRIKTIVPVRENTYRTIAHRSCNANWRAVSARSGDGGDVGMA